jgi:hypothetical protein
LFHPISLAKLVSAMHKAMRSNAMNRDNLTTPDLHRRPVRTALLRAGSSAMVLT